MHTKISQTSAQFCVFSHNNLNTNLPTAKAEEGISESFPSSSKLLFQQRQQCWMVMTLGAVCHHHAHSYSSTKKAHYEPSIGERHVWQHRKSLLPTSKVRQTNLKHKKKHHPQTKTKPRTQTDHSPSSTEIFFSHSN